MEYDISKYPKYLETKEDYEFIRNNFPRKIWEEDYKRLLEESFVDIPVAELSTIVVPPENTKTNEEMLRITARINFDISTDKKKQKWLSLLKHLKEIENNQNEVNDDENVSSTAKIEDVFNIENRDSYLNGNEIVKRVFEENSFLRYYVYRNVERQNSKIRQFGYTPEQVVDWIIGLDKKEAELQETIKENTNKAIELLMESTGMNREEAAKAIQEENNNDE